MSARVLLVDDSEANRLTLGALLEDRGYQVVEAVSFADATTKLADGWYRIAILDLHLGDGLGTDLIPELRRIHAGITVVIASGSAGGKSATGVDLFFEKSRDAEVMLDQLDQLVRRHAGE